MSYSISPCHRTQCVLPYPDSQQCSYSILPLQLVLGHFRNSRNRKNRRRLPTVAELFPEIITPLLDSADDLPACSAVEALERQEPFINQTLVYHSLAMLARLFRHGELSYHGGFVTLSEGRMSPLRIRDQLCSGRRMRNINQDADGSPSGQSLRPLGSQRTMNH